MKKEEGKKQFFFFSVSSKFSIRLTISTVILQYNYKILSTLFEVCRTYCFLIWKKRGTFMILYYSTKFLTKSLFFTWLYRHFDSSGLLLELCDLKVQNNTAQRFAWLIFWWPTPRWTLQGLLCLASLFFFFKNFRFFHP